MDREFAQPYWRMLLLWTRVGRLTNNPCGAICSKTATDDMHILTDLQGYEPLVGHSSGIVVGTP